MKTETEIRATRERLKVLLAAAKKEKRTTVARRLTDQIRAYDHVLGDSHRLEAPTGLVR